MSAIRVGAAARQLGLSADTLRYYDRIGLVRPAARGVAARRIYTETDLARLRFVRRAQAMNYSLAEIKTLLRLRNDPSKARTEARRHAAGKLSEIEERLTTLTHLRNELRLLLSLCDASQDGCPILDALDRRDAVNPRSVRRR